MDNLSTLKDLLVNQMQSLHDAENIWAVALKNNTSFVTDADLKRIFERGNRSALAHASRLQQMLSKSGSTSLTARNIVATDLASELNSMRAKSFDPEVLDAGFILVHQCMKKLSPLSLDKICEIL